MERIGVVHLARAKNGLEPFEIFLRSYAQYRAGITHDFLIVYKGFGSREEASPWEKAAEGFKHRTIFIPDLGFDLRAFRVASERSENHHLFFLNSFSEILSDDWLAKPFALVQQESVGIVGATGSWESMYSNASNDVTSSSTLVTRMVRFVRLKACQFCFDPLPNYHIRTNAFIMRREIMLKFWPRYILTKRGAYLFENGKHGLTKRIVNTGLRPIVVGKNGMGYEKTNWDRSTTFRQSNQENLLIADNQTRLYQRADSHTRRRLSSLAWGDSFGSTL